MMPLLLAPLGLLALLALAIPLLLHLVRRLQLTDTPFAALRWVSERHQPQRRLRLERPWLLLLRVLLFAALALLLAQPVLESRQGDAGADWVVVAPGADLGAARAHVGDGAQWHWLAPGFPALTDTPTSLVTPTSSLLRELDARAPASARLRIVVPARLGGLDGERLRLRHAFDWIVVPGQSPAVAPANPVSHDLVVRHDRAHDGAVDYLRAAVAAWNVRAPGCCTLDVQPLTQPLPADARWLIWLAPELPTAIRAWVERGGVALVTQGVQDDVAAQVLWRDADGAALARERNVGSGRLILVPTAFDPAHLPLLLDGDFPERLYSALRGPQPAPTHAAATAVEAVADSTPAPTGARAFGQSLRALDPWLALLISALLFAERWLATRRRGAGHP